jgi:hypothetical protein
MAPPTNSNESYCTFTLASDVTAGGLPSEADIAKDLESSDDNVSVKIAVLRQLSVVRGSAGLLVWYRLLRQCILIGYRMSRVALLPNFFLLCVP